MIQTAWIMKELAKEIREEHCVAFVCDEHEQHSPFAHEAYVNLRNNNPNASAWMGTFSTADDKVCEPLQAADAAAFEIRRALNVAIGWKPGPLRTQFEMLSKNKRVFLIQRADKHNLEEIVSTNKPGQPLAVDGIMEQQFHENIKITAHTV